MPNQTSNNAPTELQTHNEDSSNPIGGAIIVYVMYHAEVNTPTTLIQRRYLPNSKTTIGSSQNQRQIRYQYTGSRAH